MAQDKILVTILLVVGTWILQLTEAQRCTQQSTYKAITFSRMFVARYHGPPAIKTSERLTAEVLGSCISTGDHANDAYRHFESFGMDMQGARQSPDPYLDYENSKFKFTCDVRNPDANYTIVIGSTFDYAEVKNWPLLFASCTLTAKADIAGPKGTLREGSSLLYGRYRIDTDGQDLCFQFENPIKQEVPDFLTQPGLFSIGVKLWNKDLGEGQTRGTIINTNNILDGSLIWTFPADIP